MTTQESPRRVEARIGGWLPREDDHVDKWIRRLRKTASTAPRPLIKPIQDFQEMVHADGVLHATISDMFSEACERRRITPLGEPSVKNFEEFLVLLNAIMTTAPEAYQVRGNEEGKPELKPSGYIGFPINALLDWPMSTASGYDVFSNHMVNQQFKKILDHWSKFLVTKESRYVLVEGDATGDPIIIPWLSPQAQREMISVATEARGENTIAYPKNPTFSKIFNSNPEDPYHGFGSWDDFFVRSFVGGMRPVSAPDDDSVVVNACESAPFALKPDVALSDCFWLKGQPYSLENMLDFDARAPEFAGGTVYQAFLSALSYHRWHSPVSGTIERAYVVNGSYYLENMFKGFRNPKGPDPSAATESQAFLSAVATRAVIFIRADNDAIGLMCVIPIGMAEVSSCEISVREGEHVRKGDQLGMFHFGGSTHCLVFRPGVELDFDLYGLTPGPENTTNIRINTALATVR